MSRIFRAVSPVLATVCFLGATQAEPPTDDPAMGRALQHVEQSDRYLHHSRLKRGMKGYGLTVFAGTTVETFDVEIVSVVQNFDIGQDVILARASGHGLDESMIAQGMSGSPVFVKDPRDGKDKMIGAIAYGWPFSKEPLAGIQPITQMLAIAGVLDEQGKGQRAESGGTGIGGGDHGFAETVLAVELDRKQMRTFGITDAQVRSLLPTEKRSSLDGDVIRLTVVDAAEVSEIQNLKIMERNGAVVHLGDVSRVRLLGAWEGVSDLEKQKQSDGRGAPAGASRIARDRRAFLRVVLSPNRQGLNKLYEPIRTTLTARDGRSLAPLATPLSISAARPAMLAWIRKRLAPAGLAPVQGGGVGGANVDALQAVKLQPGGSLAVPYVMGDADWVGFGTVTEVIGDRVLGFGHGMAGEGSMELPMGTGYVHTIVPLMTSSFKFGSSIRMVGTLDRDEYVGVGGRVGEVPAMIPMTVTVDQCRDQRTRTFEFRILDHWYLTGRIASILTVYSASALREPPQEHHVTYDITVDFGKFGRYTATNTAGTGGLYDAGRDTELPVAAMMYNPLGEPVTPRRIDVKCAIRKGNVNAQIVEARLDGEVYQPGDTVKGYALIEPFREDRRKVPFTLKVPGDLPDGEYPLTVGDAMVGLHLQQQAQPQRFEPRTPRQLLRAVQRVVQPKRDRLHLHLEIPDGSGLAIGKTELPDLPASKADLLRGLDVPDTFATQGAITKTVESDYVLQGRKELTVTVKKHPNETPVRR